MLAQNLENNLVRVWDMLSVSWSYEIVIMVTAAKLNSTHDTWVLLEILSQAEQSVFPCEAPLQAGEPADHFAESSSYQILRPEAVVGETGQGEEHTRRLVVGLAHRG
jgi:hypothetical protein